MIIKAIGFDLLLSIVLFGLLYDKLFLNIHYYTRHEIIWTIQLMIFAIY
jgi:hypothetical protein